jgi:hypothetical protein
MMRSPYSNTPHTDWSMLFTFGWSRPPFLPDSDGVEDDDEAEEDSLEAEEERGGEEVS